MIGIHVITSFYSIFTEIISDKFDYTFNSGEEFLFFEQFIWNLENRGVG